MDAEAWRDAVELLEDLDAPLVAGRCTHRLVDVRISPGIRCDGPAAESFFGTLKGEHLDGFRFRTREEAKLEIFNYIEGYYNLRRLHSTLGYQSPDEFEQGYKLDPMKKAA